MEKLERVAQLVHGPVDLPGIFSTRGSPVELIAVSGRVLTVSCA